MIKVEKEACPLDLAPTSSATATLVWGDALAISLMNKKDFKPEDFAKSHPGGTLGKRLLLSAKDVMVSGDEMPIINHDELSKDVIKTISEKGLGVTFVKNQDNKITGLITDGDLRRMLEKGTKINNLVASDIMTENPKCISKNALAAEALGVMEVNHISQLVIDDEGTYFGIIHLHDILKEGIL